jgi:hypothetical protein
VRQLSAYRQAMPTIRERVSQCSLLMDIDHEVERLHVPPMIPFEDPYCLNEEDAVHMEPFTIGSYLAIYHSSDSRAGLEKPTCIDKTGTLEWLLSRPVDEEVCHLPIQDQFGYLVEKDETIEILSSRDIVSVRPLRQDYVQPAEERQEERIYRLIPFIPPNQPIDEDRQGYPYDTILIRDVNNDGRDPNVQLQRAVLIKQIYERFAGQESRSSLVRIPRLNNYRIRMDRVEQPIYAENSIDTLSHPDHHIFYIDMTSRTICPILL